MGSKIGPKSENIRKVNQNRRPKIDTKKGANARTCPEGRRVGRDATSNVLNISRRLVFVL